MSKKEKEFVLSQEGRPLLFHLWSDSIKNCAQSNNFFTKLIKIAMMSLQSNRVGWFGSITMDNYWMDKRAQRALTTIFMSQAY